MIDEAVLHPVVEEPISAPIEPTKILKPWYEMITEENEEDTNTRK